jgi:ParB/RepB/Spo0J family partition protein
MQTAQNIAENEMTILKIPIDLIRVNPNDPRKGVPAGAVESKMSSLQENGQETPIKVRPLSPGEIASGPLHLYELIGGHLRLEAAQRLGWPTLDALVLNISAEEAEWKAFMDNNWQEMNWFSCYLAVERRLELRPDLTQQKLAAQWGVDVTKVSWAVKVMAALNQGARVLLLESFNRSPEKDPISEVAMYRLTDLSTGKPGDLETIEKSLQVALERQMSELLVSQLVRWVQSGQEPSSLPLNGQGAEKGSKADPTDPYAHIWDKLPPNTRVIRSKVGYELRLKLAPSEAPVAVYSALAAIEHLKETALMPNSPPADPRFAQALPNLASEGRRMKAIEQGLKTAQAEDQRKQMETQKARKFEVTQSRKESQKRDELENLKLITKTHLETGFGPGLLADSLHQKVMTGQTAEAYKTIRTTFSVMGKSLEEQEFFIKPLKINSKKLARLTTNKPKAKDALSGVDSSQKTPISQYQPAPLAETSAGAAPSPSHPEPAQFEPKGESHTPGLFDLVKGAVEKVTESAESGSLLGTMVKMTLKNVKQTANYEERKEMRHLFKDLI